MKTTITYDDLHRPLAINWNGATADASVNTASRFANYTWDDCTNGKGKLCSKTDHTGTTAYTYDLWGRLSGQSFSPLGGLAHLSFGYGYNTKGQRTSMRYPSGKILLMNYGPHGRVISYQWEGATLLNNVVYQPMGGALKAWSWGASGLGANTSQVNLTFDQDGRLVHSSDIEEIDWVYDLDSRLVGKAHLGNVDLDQLYEYDAEDRLISADSTLWGGAMSYGYDNNGNRTQKLWQNDGFQWNYGLNSNRLTSVEPILNGSPTLALSVSVDAMGNIIQDAQGQSYTYDLAGRMVQSQSSAGTTHYTVNSDGLRVRKVNTGSTGANEWFVYDEQRRLIGVYDLSGNQLSVHEELVYRPESWALAFTIRGQTAGASGSAGIAYPILSDNIGTPRVVLDPTNGHKRWTWEAKEAFGMQAPVENPQNEGGFVFNARFPGQWFDEETGLFQNGYRDYNPQTGRYMQSDPIGLSAGWNTYGYVGGNPQNNTDPLGLLIWGMSAYGNGLVNQALDHLSRRSPTARKMIDAMRNDPYLYRITLWTGSNKYEDKERMSYWNPYKALAMKDTCGRIHRRDPSLSLYHELMHAYQHRFYPALYEEQSGQNDDTNYTDPEEKRVIINHENIVASEMGYFKRWRHAANASTGLFYYNTIGPTSTIEERK